MSTPEERGHVAFRCGGDADHCRHAQCADHHGELFSCSRCGGGEGSLPTECPGYRMTADQNDRVYAGWVDFVGGKWVTFGVRDRDGKMYVPKKEARA